MDFSTKFSNFAAPNLFVAQLVEQMTLNHWVEGSNPSEETNYRDVAQLASALRSGRRGRWFESSYPDNAPPQPLPKKREGRLREKEMPLSIVHSTLSIVHCQLSIVN